MTVNKAILKLQSFSNKNENTLILRWTIIALLIRIFVGVFLHVYSITHGFNGFFPLASTTDDRFYNMLATSKDLKFIWGKLPNYYPIILACLYKIFGTSLGFLVGKFLSVVTGALTVFYCGKIVQCVLEGYNSNIVHKSLNIVLLIMTFYPSHIIFSTQLLKDVPVVFLGTYCAYLALRLMEATLKSAASIVIKLVIASAMLCNMRYYGFYALIVAFAIYLFFRAELSRKKRLTICFGIAILLGMLLFTGKIQNLISGLMSWNLEKLQSFREAVYSNGDSSYGIKLDSRDPLAFIWGYLTSFVMLILGPLPWQIKKVAHAFALLESILIWILVLQVPRTIVSMVSKGALRKTEFVGIYGFTYLSLVALFSDNFGANIRIRTLGLAMLVIFFVTNFFAHNNASTFESKAK